MYIIRILRLLHCLLCFSIVTVVLLCGCSEEEMPAGVVSGKEAEISLQLMLDVPAEVTTRADMQEGVDQEIKSLWVSIYNAGTGALTGRLTLGENELDENEGGHRLHKITLKTLSGESYIVAVANYHNRYAAADPTGELQSMEEVLAAADTWEKYRAISVAFNQEGEININAPLQALLMSGFYTEEGIEHTGRPEPATVGIVPGLSSPTGAIHLRRLISQVKFNVKVNTEHIKNFELLSWEVVNVPAGAWLFERGDADTPVNLPDDRLTGGVQGARYRNTPAMSDATVKSDKGYNVYSFDFWQLENRRTGRPLPDGYDATNAYSYREKEHKTGADGRINSGKYISLVDGPDSDDPNNMATYVKLVVNMEMTVDENGKPFGSSLLTRFVETSYIVHLGYCEGNDNLAKARDFNCRRNSRYTYNVTLNNVNDVLVEAQKDGEENNPAVEGIVTDIMGNYYQLDAHYNLLNIELTTEDIEKFQYYIIAYDLNGNEVIIDSQVQSTVPAEGDENFKYLAWLELRPTTGANTFAAYKPRSGVYADGKTYLLSEVRDKLSTGYYTLFVNEYVYESGSYANGNELGSTAWRGYVNRPERRAWLNVSGGVSADGNSIYYKSKYALAQSSIQSYYNDLSDSGLGVERVNESFGLNLRNNFNYTGDAGESPGRNSLSGRYNLAQYLVESKNASLSWIDDTKLWSNFINVTIPQKINAINNQGINSSEREYSLPEIKPNSNENDRGTTYSFKSYDPDQSRSPKYVELMRACLNRNRDLDGDGKISADELRWFVPTKAQYERIILGRNSLDSRLIDYSSVSRLAVSTDKNGFNSRFLAATSDGKMMWLMEGTSSSDWRQWPESCAAPWEVRCVRNLGGDMTKINDHNVTTPAFQRREGTNIIELKYYDSKSVREERLTRPMPVHDVNDQRYNRCYKAFEFSDSLISLNEIISDVEWASYLAKNNPCDGLNVNGERGWRVPNQKEMTIIGVLGLHTIGSQKGQDDFQVTCSYSYFDMDGYAPGANPADPQGTISSEYRYSMKLRDSDGEMTQAGKLDGKGNFGGNVYRVRCVRDVD